MTLEQVDEMRSLYNKFLTKNGNVDPEFAGMKIQPPNSK